jgi:hypothetical protein
MMKLLFVAESSVAVLGAIALATRREQTHAGLRAA